MHRFFFYVIPIILFGTLNAVSEERKELSSHPLSTGYISSSTIQSQSQNEQSESSTSSLYLQFNTSGLYPSLTDWKNQLHMPDGTHPSGTNIVFGAEAGCVINRYMQVDIGYEFFFTTKVSTVETTGDQINST
jgi:hypothetical protein